ncbi:MAG: nitrilase-related carbon-nitrogen hydrolase, partial [Candidatus Contendobacter sp.]
SNDAWFKNSLAPHQHLQIVRLRALEVGRPLARATNTGISAILDERGRIQARGAQFRAEVIRGVVQPMRGSTPYTRFGDGPAVVLLGAWWAWGLFLGRRHRKIAP